MDPKVLLQSTNLDDKYFILLLQVYFSNEYFPALFLPEFTESFWQAEEKYAGILIFRRRRARVVVTSPYLSERISYLHFGKLTYYKLGGQKQCRKLQYISTCPNQTFGNYRRKLQGFFFCMSHFFGNLDF